MHQQGRQAGMALSLENRDGMPGKAIVKSSRRLSAHEWESTRKQHCVPGQRRYGDRTHAWELVGAQCIAPVAIVRKRGSVEWQTGPGC